MKVLIVEDEALAAEKLSKTLLEVSDNCEIMAVLNSVDSSIEWLRNNQTPDLILSDIHLADGLCFNIFSEIEVECPIIFTTAYEKYAIQAFEVNSVDYLLKPIEASRLQTALSKYEKLKSSQLESRTALFEEFKEMLAQSTREYKSRFLCKIGNKIKSVPVTSVRYFYSKDKMSFIMDTDGNRLPVNNTLDEIDQLVDPKNFFRVNRQFITHYGAISEINPYFKGRLKIKLDPDIDEDIVISSDKSPQFKSWLDR